MAATGLKIVLPATLTDATLPVLRDDALLTAGSLVLVDLAHSANPLAAGVPADGASIPNIAWKECAAAIGSGTQSSLAGTVAIKGSIANLTKGKVERTTKGGLHVIVSQSTALASGDGVSFNVPSAIKAYMVTNNGHSFYVSAWDRLTRANIGSLPGSASAEYDLSNANTSNFIGLIRADGTNSNAGTNLGYRYSPDANTTLGARMVSLGVQAPTGFVGSTSAQFGATWGAPPSSYNAAVLASRNNFWPSFAFYRFYIEDLTVSGRTYAQVDALDYALFQAAFATGGRYTGDTIPTAPSTIP